MSWGAAKLPSPPPQTGGLEPTDASSNEAAVPVPWWIGPDWRPLTWIVPQAYNIRTKEIRSSSGGKGSPSTVTGVEVYGDVAGIAGLGLVNRVRGLEVNGELAWSGTITRPTDSEHPDYYRASINYGRGTAYVYWGRDDQPVDDKLLAGLGATDSSLAHPAYRNQVLVVLIGAYFGDGASSVPNVRLLLDRCPQPETGNFPAQNDAQGESIVAGMLELATNPIFGAGISTDHFTAADWEDLSSDVIDAVGCHAPFLIRGRPLRDAIKEMLAYFDGWVRLRNGKFTPGMFPHDGTIPEGLTELSVHDFMQEPRIKTDSPAVVANDVLVIYRDAADLLKKKPVPASDSASVDARRGHDPKQLQMLGFIDTDQAAKWAAEAASTGAEGESEGTVIPRRARAIWAGGTPLLAGDNFNLDYLPLELDQVCRITRRVDPYRGPPTLDFVAERGIWPTPYIPPADTRPDAGALLPNEVDDARIYELTPELYGSPLGIPIAVLAQRPLSANESIALPHRNVRGFQLSYSADDTSYDSLGNQNTWAVRATLREALADASEGVTVKVAIDAASIDHDRLGSQSSEAQSNNNLLIIIGEEVFSAGDITIDELDWDIVSLRARVGSLPGAHAVDDECWLVYRDELRSYIHSRFIEDTTRYFKLQPYTAYATLPIADATAISYHFRDRAPELPVIALDAIPGSIKAGLTYYISGQISDVNGDLQRYQVNAARIVDDSIDSEFTLVSGDVPPAKSALFSFKAPVNFPQVGTWRIIVRAWDSSGYSETASDDFTVSSGLPIEDDGVTPDPITGVTVTAGLSMLVIEWTNPGNTPLLRTEIFISDENVMPASPTHFVDDPQNFYFLQNLPSSATRYVWLKAVAQNLRKSAASAVESGTTRAGIDLSDIVPGMTMVEIVNTLPTEDNFDGRTVYLTTDSKLYRYDEGLGAFDDSVKTTDLDGQITQTQITDGSISTAKLAALSITAAKIASNAITSEKITANAITAGLIAAGAITAAAVGTNEIIANTANIADGVITNAKIASLLADKITAGTLTAMYNKSGKLATDFVIVNDADTTRSCPVISHAVNIDDNGAAGWTALGSGGTNIWMHTFSGWTSGAAGYSETRFGRSSMLFRCDVNGGGAPAVADQLAVEIIYRINGGSVVQVNAFQSRTLNGDGSFVASGAVKLTGLSGSDSVQFGIRAKSTANNAATKLDVFQLTVTAFNI